MPSDIYEFDFEIIEKELVNVKLNVIDIIDGSRSDVQNLNDLSDVNIVNIQNQQYLRYNSTTKKWENVTVSEIIQNVSVFNELSTKINATQFQTDFNYLSGSLRVMLNGIKEHYITENSSNTFSFGENTVIGDIIEVHYIKL